jgi:hypothetical protein
MWVYRKDSQIRDNHLYTFRPSKGQVALLFDLWLPILINVSLDNDDSGFNWVRDKVLQASAWKHVQVALKSIPLRRPFP